MSKELITEKSKIPMTLEELQAEFFKLARAHNELCAYVAKLEKSGRVLSSEEAAFTKVYGIQ